jgi:hypothetical protein
LTLQDLLAHTPDRHKGNIELQTSHDQDHGPLSLALEKVVAVVEFINEEKRAAENSKQISELQSSITPQIVRLRVSTPFTSIGLTSASSAAHLRRRGKE